MHTSSSHVFSVFALATCRYATVQIPHKRPSHAASHGHGHRTPQAAPPAVGCRRSFVVCGSSTGSGASVPPHAAACSCFARGLAADQPGAWPSVMPLRYTREYFVGNDTSCCATFQSDRQKGKTRVQWCRMYSSKGEAHGICYSIMPFGTTERVCHTASMLALASSMVTGQSPHP